MTIKPSDESLKQGRNRSWQAVPTLNILKADLWDSDERLDANIESLSYVHQVRNEICKNKYRIISF